jgi:2-phospho-L-lactate guanylyltransferase
VRTPVAALVPVKAFDLGKTRLASALDDAERSALAEHLATGVVRSCEGMAVHVLCEDDAIAHWAQQLGATVINPPMSGLNAVIRHGVGVIAAAGFERVLVAHADLADASALPSLLGLDGIVLVPDTALDGTNVLVIPTQATFSFSYGPNSFARHLSEAERSGLPIHVVRDEGLALDLDEPADLDAYQALLDSSVSAANSPSRSL